MRRVNVVYITLEDCGVEFHDDSNKLGLHRIMRRVSLIFDLFSLNLYGK